MKLSQLRRIIREELTNAFSGGGQTTDEWDYNKPVELAWQDAIPGETPVKQGGHSSAPCEPHVEPHVEPHGAGPINAKALILKTKLMKPSSEILPTHHHEEDDDEGEEITGQEEYQDEQVDGRILKLERIVYKLSKRKNKKNINEVEISGGLNADEFQSWARRAKKMSDDALEYSIKDCQDAIKTGMNPNKYYDQIGVFRSELNRRSGKVKEETKPPIQPKKNILISVNNNSAYNTWGKEFATWLNKKGHNAKVRQQPGNYVNGKYTKTNKDAWDFFSTMWDEFMHERSNNRVPYTGNVVKKSSSADVFNKIGGGFKFK